MSARMLMYLAILGLAIFNGIYSSWSFLVFALQGIWYPGFLPTHLPTLVIVSGFISAVLHVLVTGVPVALVEKFLPAKPDLSAGLWLSVMLLPTLQTLRHVGWL